MLKIIMGYNWVVCYCFNVNFNFFVDDDIFVVVKNFDNYRNNKDKEFWIMVGKLFFCLIFFWDNGLKWFVSWEDYFFDRYLLYFVGGGVLMFWDVIRVFVVVFFYVKIILIDDFYLGVIVKKFNIVFRNYVGMVIRNFGKDIKFVMFMNFGSVVVFYCILFSELM